MGALEIFSGILLIISSLVIIVLVMLQTSKGKGLSGAIGGDTGMGAEGQVRTRDVILSKWTKVAAIVFFIATLAVTIITAITQ